jgi:ADP-heptose:LPS heptosyltransferase
MTKTIGIVRRNGLGDLLCVVPLILLCKERYPGCHITLFVDERGVPLTPYLPVDDVVVMVASSNKYASLIATLWKERRRHFDLLISAKPSPMKWLNLFLYALNGKERVAYVDEAWHSKLINSPRPFFPQEERHQMVKSLRLLDPTLEGVPSHLKPRLKVHPSFTFSQPTLLISVTNNRLGSTLDSDKMQRLINRMTKKFHIVINCELQDVKRAHLLASGLHVSSQVIPTPTFDQFMSLLASVDGCFIGDGGIMHLAAALDKPQVVLFGGTKVWEWAPLSDKAICLSDPHNVNFIPEENIQKALEEL